MSPCSIDPFFLDGPNGRIFCLLFTPADGVHSDSPLIVHVPPFGEEMNKSRKMIVTQARELAEAGGCVLLFDLYGTGDSEGEFEEAGWEGWLRDLDFVSHWAVARFPDASLWLWGLRMGCLLIAEYLATSSLAGVRAVFWQPLYSGGSVVGQLRRLSRLSTLEQAGKGGLHWSGDQERGWVEVAGYRVSKGMIDSLSDQGFNTEGLRKADRVSWLEVNVSGNGKLSHSARKQLDHLHRNNVTVDHQVINGEPFWLTPEIAVVPGLVEATRRAILGDEGQ